MRYILSLDVSAAKTGWAVTNNGKDFITGVIETKPKFTQAERLVLFNLELVKVLKKYQPEEIVIEDTFAGKNVRTLKILSEFAGVAKFTCKKTLGWDPVIVENTKVKSYFKARTKEDLFNFACEIFEVTDLNFKKDNDEIDATVQLMYYLDVVLGLYKYKFETEYGFIYQHIGETNAT
jgi:hypothetical protein